MYVVRITDPDGRRTETAPMPMEAAKHKARHVNAMVGCRATIHRHEPDPIQIEPVLVGAAIVVAAAAALAVLLVAGGAL